jgi:hypothetical protein
LLGLWESPRPSLPDEALPLLAGEMLHQARRLPFGISILASLN